MQRPGSICSWIRLNENCSSREIWENRSHLGKTEELSATGEPKNCPAERLENCPCLGNRRNCSPGEMEELSLSGEPKDYPHLGKTERPSPERLENRSFGHMGGPSPSGETGELSP